MKSFVLTLARFFSFLTIVSTLLIAVYFYYYDLSFKIPPAQLSTSYSFNDKLEFCRNKKAKIVAIGSSISLNNLSSDVIVENFNTRSYLNYGSWGLRMDIVYKLLRSISNHPKKLIIASNIEDFSPNISKNPLKYIEAELKDFLGSNRTLKFHLNHFNLIYYLENCSYYKKDFQKRNKYQSLFYDKYGGVEFDSVHFKMDKKRWILNPVPEFDTKINYLYLDSIASFCVKNKIQFFFFQSPTRPDLLDRKKTEILTEHISKIRKIITNYGGYFVNSNEDKWTRNAFVDGTHLNARGARQFTEFCFKKIKDRNK